jgi:hypothetical protein
MQEQLSTSNLTAEDRLRAVREQIRACELGVSDAIGCPYCGGWNREGAPLCCMQFAAASLAIIERRELDDNIAIADRIADKVCN